MTFQLLITLVAVFQLPVDAEDLRLSLDAASIENENIYSLANNDAMLDGDVPNPNEVFQLENDNVEEFDLLDQLNRNTSVGQTMFGGQSRIYSRQKRRVQMSQSFKKNNWGFNTGFRPDQLSEQADCGKARTEKEIEFDAKATIYPKCIRGHAFYSIKGEIRKPTFTDDSNCFIEDNIESCNFGGNAFNMKTKFGDYKFQSCAFPGDTQHLKKYNLKNEPQPEKIIDPQENSIYSSVLYRSKKWKRSKYRNFLTKLDPCAKKRIHFCDDGMYELNIRVVDYKARAAGERKFDIKINDYPIFKNVDPVMLGGLRSAIQLISLFNISNDKLYPDGEQEGIPLNAGEVDLKFCDSQCPNTLRPEFVVSGYSLHKLTDPSNPDDCATMSLQECDLVQDCGYLVSSGTCQNLTMACKLPCNHKYDCYRNDLGVWYLRGGVACRFERAPENIPKHCATRGHVLGVYWGDKNYTDNYTDYRGHLYTNARYMQPADFEDPDKISYISDSLNFDRFEFHSSVPQNNGNQTLFLYYNYLTSKCEPQQHKVGKSECKKYYMKENQPVKIFAKLPGAGFYELSITTADFIEDSDVGERRFVFSIDDLELTASHDTYKYVGFKSALELNVLFQVTRDSDGKFWIQADNYCKNFTVIDGYSKPSNCEAKKITNIKKVALSFNNGYYKQGSKNYFDVMAVSITSFGENQKCTAEVPKPFKKKDIPYSSCIRKHAFYSVHGIATPPDFEDLSGCTIADNIDSRNLNGSVLEISGNGTNAFTFSEGHLVDPFRVVQTTSLTDIKGIKNPEEKAIYTSAVYGDARHETPNNEKCAYRTIHFCEDGTYEINIRVADPFSNDKDYRRFNILLGPEYIFKEVDIFRLAKSASTAVELIAIVEITGNVLKISTNHSFTLPDGNTHLKFCYSDCNNCALKGFIVSGYTVHKIGGIVKQADVCSKHDGKPCDCTKLDECDYLPTYGHCRSRAEVCKVSCNRKLDGPQDKCYRHTQKGDNHIFYFNGGAVCEYPKGSKNYCGTTQTVTAVSFGNTTVVDHRNITFEPSSGTNIVDPGKTMHISNLDNNITLIPSPEGTVSIFSQFALFYDKDNKGEPIKIVTSLPGAGNYELSLLFVETMCEKGIRSSAIHLNGLVFVQSFDIMRYRKKFEGMEVNLLFKVIEKGGKFTIINNGYCKKTRKNGELVDGECPEKAIEDLTKFTISFHFGECGISRSFPLSGYSITKLEEGTAKDPGPKDPPQCSYSIQEFDRTALKNNICIRKWAYYSINKLPKKPSFEELGSCYIEDNLLSCDFTGIVAISGDEKTGNQYKYTSCNLFDEGEDFVIKGKVSESLSIENLQDPLQKRVFHTYQTANPTFENTDSSTCAQYTLRFCDDGIYELSIQLVDYNSTKIGERRFNIKLANHFLFQEVDIFQLAGKANTAVYLNTILIMKDSVLTVDGNDDISIDIKRTKYTHIKFCYSDCITNPRKEFIASGFTLHKLMVGPEVDTCRAHDGKPCDCIKMEGCDVFSYDNTCRSRVSHCRHACLDRDQMGGYDGCPRYGPSIYYLKGGMMCQYPTGNGYCDKYDVIDAVIMGENATDSRNIKFVNYLSSKVRFEPPPEKSAVKLRTDAVFRGAKSVFRSYVETGPLGFYLNFPDIGKYELTLLMSDMDPSATGSRDISLEINGKKLAHVIDMKRYIKDSKILEINVVFEISRRTDIPGFWIYFPGYSQPKRLGGRETYAENLGFDLASLTRMPVFIRPGNCTKETKTYFNGFSLLRFRMNSPELDACAFNHNNCECVKNPKCDWLVATQTCVAREKVCANFAKGTTCYRAGDHVFYMLGGVVCNFKAGKENYCSGFKQIVAINFGGQDVTDYRGIKFMAQPADKMHEAMKTVTGKVEGVPPGTTHDIYNTLRESQGDKFNEITFPVPLAGEGNYELSVMFFDYKPNDKVSREFSFAFNGYNLTNAFDIRRYPLDTNHTGLEINVLFRVLQNSTNHHNLDIHGLCYGKRGLYTADTSQCYNTVIQDMKNVSLTMRKGSCGGDTNFVVSGLSIIKFD